MSAYLVLLTFPLIVLQSPAQSGDGIMYARFINEGEFLQLSNWDSGYQLQITGGVISIHIS